HPGDRDHLVALDRPADRRPGADSQGARLRRPQPRARRVELASDDAPHRPERLAADPREHDAHGADRDPLRGHALLPRPGRPFESVLGQDARRRVRDRRGHGRGLVGLHPARARDPARRAGVHALRHGAGGDPRPAAERPEQMSLLEVSDLWVTYNAASQAPIPAVRGIDVTLDVGETLGIAGESGCGKSSMAGALLRLLPKGTEVTGDVLLDGEDVLEMKPGRLRAVRWTELAIVFQGALHTLNPVQRVGDQIYE